MAFTVRGILVGSISCWPVGQAFLYFPILLIARLSWIVQSVFFVFDGLPGADVWATKGSELDRIGAKKDLTNRIEVSIDCRCWRFIPNLRS